jgi:hypothetical protein
MSSPVTPPRTERIGLVGCVKQKQTEPAPARELYTSPLFRGRRAFVEDSCDRWYILSARHGLVDPGQALGPYDEAMTDASTSRRRAWARHVLDALDTVVPDHSLVTYEIHAGAPYRDFGLIAGLQARGAAVEVPAAGLTQGEQLRFYADQSRIDATAVQAVVGRLSDNALSQSPARFPLDRHEADQPGLYAWWCDERGCSMLQTRLGTDVGGLVYAGQAGASTARHGHERRATLASRIRGNHLGGSISSSTLRRTLAALLIDQLGLQLERPGVLTADSNSTLTSWMHDHMRVVIAPFPDRTALAAVERQVLRALDPPLNLTGVDRTPGRRRLTELREALGRMPDDGTDAHARRRTTMPSSAPRGPRSVGSPSPTLADTLSRIRNAVSPGDVIQTLGNPSPNRIHGIGSDGVLVSTPKSDREGKGPQLVPMWMIDDAWRHLTRHRVMDQPTVRDGLNIKRSAFVMAMLARFEDVRVRSTRPAMLEYVPPAPPTAQ